MLQDKWTLSHCQGDHLTSFLGRYTANMSHNFCQKSLDPFENGVQTLKRWLLATTYHSKNSLFRVTSRKRSNLLAPVPFFFKGTPPTWATTLYIAFWLSLLYQGLVAKSIERSTSNPGIEGSDPRGADKKSFFENFCWCYFWYEANLIFYGI